MFWRSRRSHQLWFTVFRHETWNSKWNEMLKHNLVKLYVHCEINETIEMTFKIETKLDTWHINCKFKKIFWKKKKFRKKKFFGNFFFQKNFCRKKISKKNFFFSKKFKKFYEKKNFLKIFQKTFFFLKIEFVKLNFQMQQNICKNQIGTKKASFPRSPV